MKKNLKLLALLAIVSMLSTSCGREAEGEKTPDPNATRKKTEVISTPKSDHVTELYNALLENDIHLVRPALKNIATIDFKFRQTGDTPLTLAIRNAAKVKSTSIIRALFKKNPNIQFLNSIGESPLTVAAQVGLTRIIESLIKRGADVNHLDYSGGNPLLYAIVYGHQLAAIKLIQSNARIDLAGPDGETYIELGRRLSLGKVVKLLNSLEEINDNYSKETLLAALNAGDTNLLNFLKTRVFNFEKIIIKNQLLIIAAKDKKHNSIKFILKNTSPLINDIDTEGLTAIAHSIKNLQFSSVRLLTSKGARSFYFNYKKEKKISACKLLPSRKSLRKSSKEDRISRQKIYNYLCKRRR